MARPEELVPGNCYFVVAFHDDELLFPFISTLKYVRCETDAEQQRHWLFEESAGLSEDAEGSDVPAPLLSISDDQLYQVVSFDGLFVQLREIAADHPLHPSPNTASSLATTVPADLKKSVARFLDDREYLSLTITILYTDDALSLGRRRDGEGYEVGFFTHPNQGTVEEQKILALFANLGVTPHVDYVAQDGRTRVLEFAAPSELTALVDLCGRVLMEIHGIHANDHLKYSFLKQSDISR